PAMNTAVPMAPVKVRKDFASSAGWFPSATAPAVLKATFSDSLTSWRATAVALTTGPQLGVGHAVARTQKPLMVRLEAPRFFTERDEVTISAMVTSRLEKAERVDVRFEAPGLKALSG